MTGVAAFGRTRGVGRCGPRCLLHAHAHVRLAHARSHASGAHRSRALKEVEVLRQLNEGSGACRNIVSYHGAWEEQGHLFIQMELCDRGLRMPRARRFVAGGS
jgi:hypothetical protein